MEKKHFGLCPRTKSAFYMWSNICAQVSKKYRCMHMPTYTSCTYLNKRTKNPYYVWCTLIFCLVFYTFYSILFLTKPYPFPLMGLHFTIWKTFLQHVFHGYITLSLLNFFLSSLAVSVGTHSCIPLCNVYSFRYCFQSSKSGVGLAECV